MFHLFFSFGFPPALSRRLSGPLLHQISEVWILYRQLLSISSAVVCVHFVFPYCTTWHSTLSSVYSGHGDEFNFEVMNLKLLNLNQLSGVPILIYAHNKHVKPTHHDLYTNQYSVLRTAVGITNISQIHVLVAFVGKAVKENKQQPKKQVNKKNKKKTAH